MADLEKSVERRVIQFTVLIFASLTLLATIVNIALGLNTYLIITVLGVSLVFFGLFIFIKLKGISTKGKLFLTIFSIIALNIAWYYNYNSQGPILEILIAVYAFFLFIWDRKSALYITGFIYFNIIALLVVELLYHQQLPNYNSDYTRIIDIYVGLFIVLIVIHFYTVYLKRNYLDQYERAKKSDELKSAFLANLSHEIRTPLNSIIGFSDLITNMELDENEKEQYNKIIQSNSNDLLVLIEDIVDLSMIESDQIKLVNDAVYLHDLIREIHIEYSQNREIKKTIKFINNSPNRITIIYSDILRVKQILKNLINNAIKYTENGTITIGYEVHENEVEIYISDTGIGIKEQDIKQIFNRFMKIESNTELYRGVGIGLHLSKRIANILGGDLTCKSEYGKGSTFYFTLPIHNNLRKLD